MNDKQKTIVAVETAMKPYMIFSRLAGPQEGAALVFAHTAREARVVGYRGIGSDLADGFLDLGAKVLRDRAWLFDEADPQKLIDGIAHVIDDPKSCVVCELWGGSPIGVDRMCEECREERDSELLLKAQMEEMEVLA